MSSGASFQSPPGPLLKSAILLSAVPIALAFSTVIPILPKISNDLAHDSTETYLVKMVFGIVGIAFVLGGPIAGFFVDKIKLRPLLVASCLLFAIAGVAPSVLSNLPVILLTRLVVGFTAMMAYVCGGALVAACFDEAQRARWMGIFNAVAIMAGFIGLLFAGLLGDLGWRWAFLVYLSGVVISALAWLAMGRVDIRAKSGDGSDPSREKQYGHLPLALAFLALLIGLITYVPSIYIPFLLGTLGIVRPSSVSAALMSGMVVSIITSSQFGRARLILSSRAAFCCSCAAVAGGVGTMALAHAYLAAIIGLSIQGLGLGWFVPNLLTSAVEGVDEAYRGRALGLVQGAHFVAPALGVTAFEPLAGRLGVRGVLLTNVALAILMLAGLAVSGLRKRNPMLSPTS